MRARLQKRRRSGWAGLFAGLIGGLAATIAMSQFQRAWITATRRSGPLTEHSETFPECTGTQPTDVESTRMLVSRIADLGGFELSGPATAKTALALHYGIGAGGGYLYFVLGSVAFPRFQKEHPVLIGAAFGAVWFMVADLAALLLMGFSNNDSQSPLGTRFYGISSHVVYGVTAAKTCTIVRKFL